MCLPQYDEPGSYLVVVKSLKFGGLPSGMRSWYLHVSESDSQANMESSLKQVIIVLLRGRKNTCTMYRRGTLYKTG